MWKLQEMHALFIPPVPPCNSIGSGPTMSTGQFDDVWLLVSLICIHSHGGSSGKSSKHSTVRSTVLLFAASPLKMGSSTLPTSPRMVMHLRDVLLRESSKLPVASSPTYMGRCKDITSSVNQEVFQKHTNE